MPPAFVKQQNDNVSDLGDRPDSMSRSFDFPCSSLFHVLSHSITLRTFSLIKQFSNKKQFLALNLAKCFHDSSVPRTMWNGTSVYFYLIQIWIVAISIRLLLFHWSLIFYCRTIFYFYCLQTKCARERDPRNLCPTKLRRSFDAKSCTIIVIINFVLGIKIVIVTRFSNLFLKFSQLNRHKHNVNLFVSLL
jgi:hypothetical protein